MQNPFEKIKEFLKEHSIQYELIEHEAVYTSEQAASIRGISLHQGAKALLLKAKENFILCILPGDKRLDSKKVKKLLDVKDLRFATKEEVVQIMGCEIGACYPFGNVINVRMIVDPSLSENDIISFNPGIHTRSIKTKYKDWFEITKPEVIEIIV